MKQLFRPVNWVMYSCLLWAVFSAGCASQMVTIVPQPPVNAQQLGPVKGSGAGALGVVSCEYYFIPMGLNGRMQRAYDHALAQAPGATGLTHVTLQESWYWFVIGTMRHVTITGEAVK